MSEASPNKKTPQKEVVEINQNSQYNMLSVINHMVHSLPPLPSCELTDPHDDMTLPRLIEALQNRQTIRQMMIDEYRQAADRMKSMLQEVDNSLITKENLIHEQNGKLVEKNKIIQSNKAEIERLEKRTGMQEHNIDNLQKINQIHEDDMRSLQQELESIEQRLQEELSAKRRMEQHMHDVVKKTQRKWERECDRRMNVMRTEMESKLWLKEEVLKQVKAIVKVRNPENALSPPDPPPLQTQPKTQFREEPLAGPVGSPHVRQGPDSLSGEDEVESNPRPVCPLPSISLGYHSPRTPATRAQSPAGYSVRRSCRRAMFFKREQDEANSPTYDLELMKRSYRTTTPVRPLHRRSRSAGGEKWVDHKPSSTLDLGTVLQPVIPNAIQVSSSPNEKTLSKCDRYALTHQEVASNGEIRTKVIKGDVIKTRGGGQAVQFTDIETLNQELTAVSRRRKP